MTNPTIGVLALQGDVREHARALETCGATVVTVRRASELGGIDGLVIPGGESTTMDKLVRAFGLFEPLRAAIAGGMPVYGSCAGMIMLADRIVDGRHDQQTLGGMDVLVRRNAFGRQNESFEADLRVVGMDGPAFPGVFIRAPWVQEWGPQVEVLAEVGGHPVAIREGTLLATSFHPEVSGDDRVHRLFVGMLA